MQQRQVVLPHVRTFYQPIVMRPPLQYLLGVSVQCSVTAVGEAMQLNGNVWC